MSPMSISKLCGLAVLLLACACATSAAAQQYRGTAEQRNACTHDAFRLCANFIPDAGKVELCLRRKKADLSQGCRSVFDRHAYAELPGGR
jgi:hypothetical protein